jgi:hypothetical protein
MNCLSDRPSRSSRHTASTSPLRSCSRTRPAGKAILSNPRRFMQLFLGYRRSFKMWLIFSAASDYADTRRWNTSACRVLRCGVSKRSQKPRWRVSGRGGEDFETKPAAAMAGVRSWRKISKRSQRPRWRVSGDRGNYRTMPAALARVRFMRRITKRSHLSAIPLPRLAFGRISVAGGALARRNVRQVELVTL